MSNFLEKKGIDLMAININGDQINGQIFLIFVRISRIFFLERLVRINVKALLGPLISNSKIEGRRPRPVDSGCRGRSRRRATTTRPLSWVP